MSFVSSYVVLIVAGLSFLLVGFVGGALAHISIREVDTETHLLT